MLSCLKYREDVSKGVENKNKLYKDRDWLYQRVVVEGKRDAEIAEMFGVDRKNISYWRDKKFGIKSVAKRPENKSKIYLSEENVEYVLHQYFTKKVSMLNIGENLSVSPQIIARTIRSQGYETRDVGEASKIFSANDNFFNAIDTEEKAYWLGMLYADGTIQEGRGTVSLGLKSDDEPHIQRMLDDMESDNPIKTYSKKMNGKTFYSSKANIYSRQLTNDLVALGCFQNKSLSLEFPTESQVPRHLIFHFIRGYFDGDGSISYTTPRKTGRRQYKYSVVGTEEFIDSLKTWLGIGHLKTSKRKNKNLYCVGTSGRFQVDRVMKLLYEDATVYLERKYKIYQEMLEYAESNPYVAWNKGMTKEQELQYRMENDLI